MKPTLRPETPIEDRTLLALLWRLREVTRESGDQLGTMRLDKAMDAAQAVYARVAA